MSFRANSFARFSKKYGIEIEISPYDPYGLVANSHLKESKDFMVNVYKKDRFFSFSVVFDDYRTELPSVEDVLEYIANEAAIHENFKSNPEAFARLIKRPLAYAEGLLRDVSSTVPGFELFLGPEAYDEFLRITEVRR